MNSVLNLIPDVCPILSALLAFGLGAFVFFRNIRHPANIGFGLGMFCYVLIEGGNAVFILSTNGAWAVFGKSLSLIGEAVLPSAWFLFSLTFARANYKEILSRWVPVLTAVAAGSLFFIFWQKSALFFSLPTMELTHELLILGPVGRYFYVFIIIGMILNLIHLENTLRFSYGSTRQQIKYLIIGVGSLLSFQIFLASRRILFSVIDIRYIPVASVVVLLSSALMLVAIVKQKLLDVNVFISRYVIYNSLTLFLVGLYLLIVGIVTQGIKLLGGPFDTFWGPLFLFASLIGIVAVLLSIRVRRKLQLFIIKHFYRHKYDFKDKWMETIEKMGSKGDRSLIQKITVEMISETMGAREVFLWIYDPSSRVYNMATSTVSTSGQLQFSERHHLISFIRRHPYPFFITEIVNEDEMIFTKDIAPLVIATKAVLCTPLIAGGNDLIGFILQGEDISGEQYTEDDIDLLKAIAAHVANIIRNICLTEDIVAAKEAETFHQVSTFFIHDLKNLVSTLSLLVQNAEEHLSNPDFQEDAMKTLKTTVSKMNSMISNLTLVAKGLRINPCSINLNTVLEETLSCLNGQGASRIEKHIGVIPTTINADGEQLKKVFLNLLLNAIEASPPGSKIEVETLARNGDAIFCVKDNGCGISPDFIQASLFRPFKTTKSNGLGIGLFHCKKIIDAHEGKIEVESVEGEGSVFRVILPLENVQQV